MEKKESKNLTHRIHTRITEKKFNELKALMERSQGLHSLSALLRNILEGGKITVLQKDGSRVGVLEELALIRREIQSIGVNINQATRRINSESLPAELVLSGLEITQLFQQADLRISRLFVVMANLSETW